MAGGLIADPALRAEIDRRMACGEFTRCPSGFAAHALALDQPGAITAAQWAWRIAYSSPSVPCPRSPADQ